MASPLTETLTRPSLEQRTDPTSGPLYNVKSGEPPYLDIATNDDADWFTTALCALASVNDNKVKGGITPSGEAAKDAESATFSVYGLDGKVKPVAVNYKSAAGPTQDNAGSAWYVGGLRQAIISLGKKDKKDEKEDDGNGVVNGELFKNVKNADKKKVAEAGKWGFKYLTGVDAVEEDPVKDAKDWDTWMAKVNHNPIIILTNDKVIIPGLMANQYYTLFSQSSDAKSVIVWRSTDLSNSQNTLIFASQKDLRTSTQSLYHLKDWAAY
nr:hypothetical protein L204_01927 [Cryptococcus depauperatus CBS 7855]